MPTGRPEERRPSLCPALEPPVEGQAQSFGYHAPAEKREYAESAGHSDDFSKASVSQNPIKFFERVLPPQHAWPAQISALQPAFDHPFYRHQNRVRARVEEVRKACAVIARHDEPSAGLQDACDLLARSLRIAEPRDDSESDDGIERIVVEFQRMRVADCCAKRTLESSLSRTPLRPCNHTIDCIDRANTIAAL
jgi:hypothetical protein